MPIKEIFETDEHAVRVVHADAIALLGPYFAGEEAHEFAASDVLRSESGVLVQWTWSGLHHHRFLGIGPHGAPVRIDGTSKLQLEGDQVTIRRYIDWHGVFAQLGSLPGRAARPTHAS